jgi:hypothetical protein
MQNGATLYNEIASGKDCWGDATAHFKCLDTFKGTYGKFKKILDSTFF